MLASVSRDAQRRPVRVVSWLASPMIFLLASAVAADGNLDPGFGVGGFLYLDEPASAFAATPDGGLVIARIDAPSGADSVVAVHKLDSSGQPVPSFGDGGRATISTSSAPEQVQAVAVDDAGGIYVTGTSAGTVPPTFFPNNYIFKLTPGGALDESYGTGGFTGTATRNLIRQLDAEVQPDGKLVIGAYQGSVYRITADGVGRDISEFNPTAGFADLPLEIGATGLAIDSLGRLVVSGYLPGQTSTSSAQSYKAVRLLPNGGLDMSFGINGVVDIPVAEAGLSSFSTDVAVDHLDRVYLTGLYQMPPEPGFVSGIGSAVLRLQPNGALDTSFADNGIALVEIPGRNSLALTRMLLENSGRIIVGGDAIADGGSFCNPAPRFELFVVALMPDGRLDAEFGLGGWQEVDTSPTEGCGDPVFFGPTSPALELASLSDGRIAALIFGFSDDNPLAVLSAPLQGAVDTFEDPRDWFSITEPGSLLNFSGLAEPDSFLFIGWPGRFEESGLTIQNNTQMFVLDNQNYGPSGPYLLAQGTDVPQVVEFTFPPGVKAFSFWSSPVVPGTVSINGMGEYPLPTIRFPGVLNFFGVTSDVSIKTARISVVDPFLGLSSIDLDSVAFTTGLINQATDTDGDGVPDSSDNCIQEANGPLITDAGGNVQLDTDGDGFGNVCDADLNNDGFVNFADLAAFKTSFGGPGTAADLDGSGFVNFADLSQFKARFGQPPGPSGVAP